MRRFSTNQLSLFDSPSLPTSMAGASVESSDIGASTPSAHSSTTLDVEFPDFGSYAESRAETARIAGRIAASYVSEEEHQAFLRERQFLLDKVFTKTITREEENRLEYVRWSLDRIEDAKHGGDLDRIEETINRYEHFLQGLDAFKAALTRATKTRR
jgi:hypothetical protein